MKCRKKRVFTMSEMRLKNAAISDNMLDSLDDYHSICLRKAARARGIDSHYGYAVYSERQPFHSRWLSFRINGQEFLFSSGMLVMRDRDPWGRLGMHVNEPATILVRDKHRLKGFLEDRGFSAPKGRVFRRSRIDDALNAFGSIPGPLCVKPNQGTKGDQVYIDLRDRRRYEAAVRRVAADYQKILVEESAPGSLIRFFYVRPHVVALKLSRPASVVGNGTAAIAALIAAKNAWRDRRAVPGHANIVIDDGLREFLAMQGRSLDNVPAAGVRVFLRGTSNGATGADSVAIPGSVHSSYAAVIEQACNAVPGLNITAADVVVRDPAAPAAYGNYWILEMNRNPGLTPYHFPWRGEVQDIAGAILDFLLRGENLPA